MITGIYKILFKFAPDYFYSKIINLLIHKKPLELNFISDKYIYKSIDKGYAILYKDYNFGQKGYIFSDFNYSLNNLNAEILKNIHSFHWVQDLKIIDTQISNLRIFDLINSWIDNYGIYKNSIVFEHSVLAARIFNWLTSPSIINIKKDDFKNKFIRSLSFQIRLFLKLYSIKRTNNTLLLNKALFVIGKSIESNRIVNIAIENISIYLKDNILADGGILDKSPSYVLEVLEHVLFIFRNLNSEDNNLKSELRAVVDKIIVFIKSVRYKDGGLGVFNGSYEEDSNKLNFLLSLGNVNAKNFNNLRYSGYLSLTSNNIIDVMLKTNSILADNLKNVITKNSNSLLSQEILIHGERIFVNNSSNIAFLEQKLKRNSYSTLLFYDKNGKLIDMPSKHKQLDCQTALKSDHEWNSVTFTYKGLEDSYGLLWYKTLHLAKTESCLLGEELINLNNKSMIGKVILKFILHPSVIVKNYIDGKNIILLVNKEEWVFKATNLIYPENELYQGIRDELFPTISLNIPMNMKTKAIEWSVILKEFLNKSLK